MTSSADNSEPVPPGWGEDELTQYMNAARSNTHASFHLFRREYSAIRIVDQAFLALISGWMDPENVAAAPFTVRSLATYRAAAQLALAGQLAESYMVMRGCLEHALYGNYIDVHPECWQIWSKRGEGEKERKLCANTFSGRNLFAALRGRDQRLGDAAGELYERTIEFGAHLNEMAFGSTTEVNERDDGGLSFEHSFLSGDGEPLHLCIRSLTQTGLIVLDIWCLVFPRRSFESGVQARTVRLKPFF